ncbi:NlpC/P60 family protein [Peptococcaceae bacterium 1198_IL3148]
MLKSKLFIASIAMGVSFCLLPNVSFADTQYTVKNGDSLWKISQSYGTTVDNIRSLNNLTSDLIRPGQTLIVSKDGSAAIPATTQVASRSGSRTEAIIDYAKSFIGTPYRGGGSSPSGFDCSGYTQYVFANFNVDLPRTASSQYHHGQGVSADEAKAGDLVAFKSGGSINHVGIYLGNGSFIHSSSSKGIAISSVYDSYWGPRLLGFSRVMP